MRRTFVSACVLLAACNISLAQRAQISPTQAKTAPEKSKAKLNPVQQKASSLLEAARSEAGGFEPDMSAFVLWHAALGLERIDKAKSMTWLEDAFRASQSVEERNADTEDCGMDQVCHVKRFLQSGILQAIVARDPAKAEHLLRIADPKVRSRVTESLITRYISEKKLGRAQSLLAGEADTEEYPYRAAIALMEAVPTDAERLTIFNQALSNFRQHGEKSSLNITGDLGAMISRFYGNLPPGTVLDAIDALLDAAKEQDKQNPMHLSFSTGQGKSANLNSAYETRVFEVLPVLEQLDPSRAEELLKENAELRSLMTQYPQGLASIQPKGRAEGAGAPGPGGGVSSMSFSTGSVSDAQTAEMQARNQVQAQITRQMNQVSTDLASDPKQALADALSMPLGGADRMMMSPRLQALMKVARATVTTHPDVANSALDNLDKAAESLEPERRARTLIEAIGLYVRLGRREQARSVLLQVAKAAEELYKKDSDANDPNLAFKGVWPSTGLWGECVEAANSVSPDLAEQIIGNIADPEIASYMKVSYANSLVGRKENPEMAEQHKGNGAFITSF